MDKNMPTLPMVRKTKQTILLCTEKNYKRSPTNFHEHLLFMISVLIYSHFFQVHIKHNDMIGKAKSSSVCNITLHEI